MEGMHVSEVVTARVVVVDEMVVRENAGAAENRWSVVNI